MRKSLIFIHGWGFNAAIWQGIIARLPGMSATCIDLGYIDGAANSTLEIPDKTVIVGHSLGLLWALKHLPSHPQALISICGFDRFSPPVPRQNLAIMMRGLKRNPMAQMTHFWRSCGIPPFTTAAQLNQSALQEGLQGLMHWNAQAELKSLSCPVLALAARNDEIVGEEMSQSIWKDQQIVWSNEGGHALPLSRASWCAEQIGQFVDQNE